MKSKKHRPEQILRKLEDAGVRDTIEDKVEQEHEMRAVEGRKGTEGSRADEGSETTRKKLQRIDSKNSKISDSDDDLPRCACGQPIGPTSDKCARCKYGDPEPEVPEIFDDVEGGAP